MIALNSPDCLLSPQLVSVWYFCHIRVIQFSTGSYTGEVQIVQCFNGDSVVIGKAEERTYSLKGLHKVMYGTQRLIPQVLCLLVDVLLHVPMNITCSGEKK